MLLRFIYSYAIKNCVKINHFLLTGNDYRTFSFSLPSIRAVVCLIVKEAKALEMRM